MSRSNPEKIKPQSAQEVALIYCEGKKTEQALLKRFRTLYSVKTGLSARIYPGIGGAPLSMVQKALRVPGAFNQRVVFCDGDSGSSELKKAQALASSQNVFLIVNRPCIEAVILAILSPQKDNFSSKKTKELKTLLTTLLNGTDLALFLQKKMTRKQIEAQRKTISSLNAILSLLENQGK